MLGVYPIKKYFSPVGIKLLCVTLTSPSLQFNIGARVDLDRTIVLIV